MASFVHLVAIILIGISGYRGWDWPYPVGIAVVAFIAFQVATGFQSVALARTMGLGFVVRQLLMAGLLFTTFWLIGLGLSAVIG
jgi:hypothetical protein